MTRVTVRLILALSFLAALAAIVASLKFAGWQKAESWATVAAALAVITSIFSSWSSHRVLEVAEDEQQPYPYPSIDLKSRYGFMQLRLTNYGGSTAHNIRIKWHKPLLNNRGELVCFSDNELELSILLPKQSVSVLVGSARELYQRYQDMNYSGSLEFKNASGRKKIIPFQLSAEIFRSSLIYDQEDSRTHYELQKIPQEISKLTNELKLIKELLHEQSLDTVEGIWQQISEQPNDDEFEAVADQLAGEFAACVGANASVLSDYAVSRASIYEDHP